MGLPQAKIRLTPQEYLLRERAAEIRSEFYQGEMFAMAGGSPTHSLIKANVVGELREQMRDGSCVVYDSDLRVKIDRSGLYTYPDATVVCGPLEFDADDDRRNTVINPTLIAEVLSDSTEAYDRGKKFEHFRRIASLREYLLVSQNEARIELYSRNTVGVWTLSEAAGMESVLAVPALAIEVRLGEIFAKVDFTDSLPELPS